MDGFGVFLCRSVAASIGHQELSLILDLLFVLIDLSELALYPVKLSPQIGGLLSELISGSLNLLSNFSFSLNVLLKLLLDDGKVFPDLLFFRFKIFCFHSQSDL